MDFPIHIDTIAWICQFLILRGQRSYLFLSLKMIVFILASIAVLDEMLHYVAFHCVFHVCQSLVYLVSYRRHCVMVLEQDTFIIA